MTRSILSRSLGMPEDRHPDVRHFNELFAYSHLPEFLQFVSSPFAQAAATLLDRVHDGPELVESLRRLLDAKDAAVRQAVLDKRKLEMEGQ